MLVAVALALTAGAGQSSAASSGLAAGARGIEAYGSPSASAPADTSRWEAALLPAISYDADEGFGYGVLGAVYEYGNDGRPPYRFTVQPQVLRTTGGRRDYEVFFDAPGRLVPGWHLTAEGFREQLLSAPFYGIGNETAFEPDRTDRHPHFYQYQRTRTEGAFTVQRPLGDRTLRLLAGWRIGRSAFDPHADATPGSNRFLDWRNDASPSGHDWLSAPRVGLVWDGRDRKVGTRRGIWSELLLERALPVLGSDHGFTRLTGLFRHYRPLSERFVAAVRLIGRQILGDPPFHELSRIQTSRETLDGLGGSDTVRGVPKHRFVGRGLLAANLLVRGRLFSLQLLGREIDVLGTVFTDGGRVWTDRIVLAEAYRSWHGGFGGGLRLRSGRSLVAGAEVAHGAETGTPIYVRFGYLF